MRAATAAAAAIDRFIHLNRDKLIAKDAATTAELAALLTSLGLVESPTQLLPRGGWLLVDGGHCLTLGSYLRVAVPGDKSLCSDTPGQRWFLDARGALHSEARPDLCLVPARR